MRQRQAGVSGSHASKSSLVGTTVRWQVVIYSFLSGEDNELQLHQQMRLLFEGVHTKELQLCQLDTQREQAPSLEEKKRPDGREKQLIPQEHPRRGRLDLDKAWSQFQSHFLLASWTKTNQT